MLNYLYDLNFSFYLVQSRGLFPGIITQVLEHLVCMCANAYGLQSRV